MGLLLALGASGVSSAASSEDARARAALTVLRTECFSCHGETRQKGGLSLLTREGILKGGDEGPVATPGRPDASKLFNFLQAGADPHMPPKKQLDPAQIKAVRDWVKSGLIWDQAALDDEVPRRDVTLAALPGSYQPVMAVALSPDAQRLVLGRGGRLALYDLSQTNFTLVAEDTAHRDAVESLAWSHDGQRLASGGFRSVRFWNGSTLREEQTFTNGLSGRITAMEFTPDDSTLAIADGGNGQAGYVRMLDASGPVNQSATHSWKAHADTVFDLEFSRDGSRLLTAGGDQRVRVWDVSTRRELAALEGPTAQVLGAAFNTNATQVVSGGADRQLAVWDIATREKIISLGKPVASINAVAWPGDGTAILAVTDAGALLRYTNLKAHTGEQSSASGDEKRLAELPDAALCVSSSADGTRIVAGAHDGSVRLWDAEGKLLAELAPAAIPTNAVVATGEATRRGKPALPAATPISSTRAASGPESPLRVKPSEVVSLRADPEAVMLSADSPRHGVILTAHTADGFDVDVTEAVRFRVSRGAPFTVGDGRSADGPGAIIAMAAGNGVVTARFGRHEVSIPVTAFGDRDLTPPTPGFVRDVLPVLNQAGCASGGCHAKPEGQNGFKLSVFTYDPRSDYAEIVKDARGRRIFPAAPDESLVLLKPLGVLPHEGGQRFARGSATHRILERWLRAGMPYALTNEPMLQRITIFPKERRYRKGSTQRLLVTAHYSDGSERDVTRLAAYDSNDREAARVDEPGRLTIGSLTGPAVIVARYMGFVADAQILVPAERLLPGEQYANLPVNNFIDRLATDQFQRLGLFPSELCSDSEFLRRAKLDAVGLLPTPDEARAFATDTSVDKRQRFIAQVLDDPAYADFWANQWADLLRPNPDRVGVKSVFLLDQWLRERFRVNQPYDQFAREILLTEGSSHRAGPAVIYRDRREPPELTTLFSQVFLGTRLECAKCHHHPNEKWSQDDFYQFAAFFGPLKQKGAGLSPPISAGTETFYFAPGGAVKHPVTGGVMVPRPPDGPAVTADSGDPRRALADWLTAPENPFFARAAVNRVWGHFFGRGLVHPVDDFRTSNPCVNPQLLDALAADFVAHGYDLKHLIRTLLESRTYQLSTEPNESNLSDTRNFSRAYRRRLPAEVIVDAVTDASGVDETFAAIPSGSRATQAWSYKIESHFMDAFGRPNSSSDCPCERDTQLSVAQSLHLMNSRNLQAKLSDPAGRVRKLADGPKSPEEITTELYLATLSRPPTDTERTVASAAFTAPGATRQTAAEDVFWALLNSPEFVLNH